LEKAIQWSVRKKEVNERNKAVKCLFALTAAEDSMMETKRGAEQKKQMNSLEANLDNAFEGYFWIKGEWSEVFQELAMAPNDIKTKEQLAEGLSKIAPILRKVNKKFSRSSGEGL